MSQLHIVSSNGRRKPELVKSARQSEQDATYYAAVELVLRIDDDLTRGVRHYRTKTGMLLNTLDEVINAILGDDLLLAETQYTEEVWRHELAA
jgi:hypothetical protein